jgi:thymidylate synthase ThyX
MLLIKPSFEILAINGADLLLMEKAGRTCYKSEAKGEPAKFLASKIKAKHLTIIEHGSMTVRFVVDRGFTHELVRHRLAVYSQECISGDSFIRYGNKKEITIKDLYNRQQGSCYDKTHNKTIYLRSVNETGDIIPNKFNEVFFKGKNEVFKITTKLGYSIKCTKNHRFLTDNNTYKTLKELNIGDTLFVNGRPSLATIDDITIRQMYLVDKLNLKEISEATNSPISSISRKLHQLEIFKPHLNDKNKEKYNKNHTEKSYIKMRKTISQQYIDGREVWNKGITGEKSHSFNRIITDQEREKASNAKLGDKNPNWSGGPKKHNKAQILKENITNCELCKRTKGLCVHHKDQNPNNNSMENIIKVCSKCHHLLHWGWHVGTKIIPDTIVSIEYSGIEDTYDIEMKEPYHNYIVNGFAVHNSTRYCNYSGGVTFIIPPWVLCPEGEHVSVETFPLDCQEAEQTWFESCLQAEKSYSFLIHQGWSPQQARTVLPNSLKTEIVMTANFREWRLVFEQRALGATGKPHPQMSEIMIPLLAEAKNKISVIFDDLLIK